SARSSPGSWSMGSVELGPLVLGVRKELLDDLAVLRSLVIRFQSCLHKRRVDLPTHLRLRIAEPPLVIFVPEERDPHVVVRTLNLGVEFDEGILRLLR